MAELGERTPTGGTRFTVRFWGVRGSIACPGTETARYGGNTACLEVRCGPHRLILDGGTGLREFDRAVTGVLEAEVLFTHAHLDHICGWPFFARLREPTTRLVVRAGHLAPPLTMNGVLDRLLHEPFVPVAADRVRARLAFRDFNAGETLAPRPGLVVRTAPLNHPQGATGYRIEWEGRSLAYVTDTEHVPGHPDRAVLGLIEGADLVVYDCTYTDDEFPKRIGWGHSTWQEGVRLCEAAGAGRLVVFHHDPDHDDAFMDSLAEAVNEARPGSIVAREGLVLVP